MGTFHNDIIHLVHDKIKQISSSPSSSPSTALMNDYQYTNILLEELSQLCLQEEETNKFKKMWTKKSKSDCREDIYQEIIQAKTSIQEIFQKDTNFDFEEFILDIPVDEEFQFHLYQIYNSLSYLKNHSLEESMTNLAYLMKQMEDLDMKEEFKKQALISVVSIAMGSTKLWMDALGDETNEFRRIHHDRLLQLPEEEEDTMDMLVFVYDYVLADVLGAIRGLIPALLYINTGAASVISLYTIARTSLTWSLEVVGIYLPYPMDFALCLLGEVIPIDLPDSNIQIIDSILPPEECTLSYLLGPTIATIVNGERNEKVNIERPSILDFIQTHLPNSQKIYIMDEKKTIPSTDVERLSTEDTLQNTKLSKFLEEKIDHKPRLRQRLHRST